MSRISCNLNSVKIKIYFFVYVFASLFCASQARAGLDPYTVASPVGNTYVDIVGGAGTAAVTSWRNNDTIVIIFPIVTANSDENLSSNLLNIGFTFYYDGSPQTQFRVGVNGFITFNTATNATGSPQPACGDGDAYSGDNAIFSTPGTKGTISAIAPFYDDLEAEAYSLTSSIHYQTSGTAPNRVLTVQWRGLSKYVNTDNCSPCSYGNYNFQIKLYETSGNIEFVYGTMTTGADEDDSPNYSCGMNSASLTASPTTAQLLSQQQSNTNNFTSNHVSNLLTVPTSNTKITFTRTAPAPATGVPTCINYNFPANGATNQCRNSYISWSACDGVPTMFDVYFGTASNPPLALGGSNKVGNFFNPGTLTANTTYYWKVVPENSFGSATTNTIFSFTTGGGNSAISITSSLGNTICVGQTTTLTVNGSLSEGSVYNWTSPFLLDLGCKINPPPLWSGDCEGNPVGLTFLLTGTYTYDVFAKGCNGTSSCARITLTVIESATAPTSIQSSAGFNVCRGTGTTLTATGGTGSQYQWFTGSCGGTPVQGNTASIGATMTGGTTTYYVRRIDECTNAPTTCASYTLNEFILTVGNNNIGVNQTICTGEVPSALLGFGSPTGGNSYAYAWESSTTSDSTGFATATGVNNQQNYAPGTLSNTTWFRRIVIAKNASGLNCSDANVSNVIEITVPGNQCDDGNTCTNDFCQGGICSYQCTLNIDNLAPIANTIHGCNDGSISATVAQSCAWTTTLYSGLNVVRTWPHTSGSDIFWDNVSPGNYLMVASEPGGCRDSATNVIVNTGLPCSIKLDTVASTPTSVQGCDDGSINAIVNAFVCDGEWSAVLLDEFDVVVGNWSFGNGTAVLWEDLPSGNYSILAVDNGVCQKQVDVSVPSGPPCHVTVQNVQKSVVGCDNNSVTADISSLTCSGEWYAYLYVSDYSSFVREWNHTQGASIAWDSLPLGEYHLFATDFASCSDTFDVALSCSDNDPCTIDDCNGGCSHTYKCEDNNLCTEDFCQVNGQCLYPPIICNDGNTCTNDACMNGNCVSTSINCADVNPCTVDQCFNGNCTHTAMVCSDGNSCTNDFCQAGNCIFQPTCILDDSNPCTDDLCVNRTCLHPPKNCNDNNSCTTDLCQGQCIHNPICTLNDGNPCTKDQCLNGSCAHVDTCSVSQCTVSANCSDGILCTTDTCINGDCVFIPKNCDDGVSCTTDACNSLNGNCVFTPTCTIDDGDPCTLDGCLNGSCLHAPKNCNDGSSCTNDFCQSGNCIFQPVCILNDLDPCTNDFCLSGQCIHQDIFCNDGILCTNDSCIGGACVYNSITCKDENPCTTDSCLNGNCIFFLILNCTDPCDLLVCGDGVPCTIDSCSNSNCFYPPVNCDDNNPCTIDSCNGGSCVHLPVPNCSLNISGAIVTETNIPVLGVTVKLTGAGNQNFITSNTGLFNFNVSLGDNCSISASKSNDSITNNGVSTLDIILIQRQILAVQQLGSPYKKIAADVNNSQTITTLDIVFIRTVILQSNPTFPNGRLWAFVNSDFVFTNDETPFPFDNFRSYPNISAPHANQNFIAMKLGDVNNSWNQNIAKLETVGEVHFITNDYNAIPGDELIVPVKVKDFNKITGFQFTLAWNPEVLQLLEVKNSSLNGFYGMNATNEGFLTTSWFDEMTKDITLADGEAAFDLIFKVTGTVGSSSDITIGSQLTETEAYNQYLDLLSIVPVNGIVKVGNGGTYIPNSECCDLKAVPNPFSNSTNIIFSIPKDENVSIVIYDLLGKEVKHIMGDFKSGEHSIEWAGEDNAGKSLSRGLYHVRMVTGKYSQGMKVLLIK